MVRLQLTNPKGNDMGDDLTPDLTSDVLAEGSVLHHDKAPSRA
jgi:hypothetical protein